MPILNIKKTLRAFLGPLLPIIRTIRNFPAQRKAEQCATLLKPAGKEYVVCYVTRQFPKRPALRTEFAHGGEVKMTFLSESFPHSYPTANIVYGVSSVDHVAKVRIVRRAKQNGLKIVINQNGVAYKAWYGHGWEESNRMMRQVYELADYIVYQSDFCRLGAEKFLSKPSAPSRIIYNPVNLNLYRITKPYIQRSDPVLLLGGNQFAPYRFEAAIQVLKIVCQQIPATRLIITGNLWGENQKIAREQANTLIDNLNLTGQVEFTGPYSQDQAVNIFQRADILIHTQYNDASPSLIGESLACGVPVVYCASGGVPELVGPDAGIGISVEQSWEKINLADPNSMAEAVLKVFENKQHYSDAARQRAVEKFSLEKFIQHHREIFAQLLD
jgi:glycosyltransferase involved in cell wall biosynthesis